MPTTNSNRNTNGSVVLNHPTGNQFSRAALVGLVEEDLLDRFYTSIATYPGNVWSLLASTSLGRGFTRREYPHCIRPFTKQRPWIELGRMFSKEAGISFLNQHESGLFSIDAVYHDLDRKVARDLRRGHCRAVYAYEDGALESFRVAKSQNTKCLYDLPIGYWRAMHRLLESEGERWPEWTSTMPTFRDSEEKLARKDEELHLADRIYVASTFTRTTLEDYPGKLAPIETIPYGYPEAGKARDYNNLSKRKLKLLFVGGLSQRKGIADVFKCVSDLRESVELTVIGNGPVESCPALGESLKNHRWIRSLPHSQVVETMRHHDVLLFPSLFEGFGLVITEAMSQGTPVITTNRTAGVDLIEHGHNGWLIEPGSTAALRQQIEAILNDTDSIAFCGENARLSAIRRPWSCYGKELAASVIKVLETAA